MEIRHLDDMKMVLYDKAWAKTAPQLRGLLHAARARGKNDLRYDITTIPPRMLGQEFVKTKDITISGGSRAIYYCGRRRDFLMQKEGDRKIKDVCYVKATRGDCVLVPPLYGHVTINTTSKTLKTGNRISEEWQSAYKSIETKRGFSYYYMQAGWTKNKNYEEGPELCSAMPLESMPRNLDFLKQPKTKLKKSLSPIAGWTTRGSLRDYC